MRQLQLFISSPLAQMRDRTAARNYSPEGDHFAATTSGTARGVQCAARKRRPAASGAVLGGRGPAALCCGGASSGRCVSAGSGCRDGADSRCRGPAAPCLGGAGFGCLGGAGFGCRGGADCPVPLELVLSRWSWFDLRFPLAQVALGLLSSSGACVLSRPCAGRGRVAGRFPRRGG
jgi:hypothetical protein